MQVARSPLAALEWTGLFDSNFERRGLEAALYMLRPYEHGKIPVVFVHGLASSPRAWVQTINELQNNPSIAAHYQFWMFLYPTGQPIPGSADQLRRSLIKARETFDPRQSDATLDRMVLVGHSMGGLLSKMMVQDSGLALWDATITVPRDQFKGSPQTPASHSTAASSSGPCPSLAGSFSSPRRIAAVPSLIVVLVRPSPVSCVDQINWTRALLRSRP